jgi:hypothetical protein
LAIWSQRPSEVAWCFFSQVSKALAFLNKRGARAVGMVGLAAGIA